MFSEHDFRSLSLLFHINSEPWLNLDAYDSEGYEVRTKQITGTGPGVPLPKIGRPDGLSQLLQQRSSCRSYRSHPLDLKRLAEILAGSYGPTRVVRFPNGLEMEARATPSAGGLFPLELYVVCRRIDDLPDGLYHYNLLHHQLIPLRPDVGPESISEFLLAAPFIDHANAVVFLGAVFDRTLQKYGARGYRYILLEAGHVAQNLCLLATERSLGSLCIGGFMDGKINRYIGLDGVTEAVVYGIAVGHPAEKATLKGSSGVP